MSYETFITPEEHQTLEDNDPDMLSEWPSNSDFILSTSPPITNRQKLLQWWFCLPEPSNDVERDNLQVLVNSLRESVPEKIEPIEELTVEDSEPDAETMIDLLHSIGQNLDLQIEDEE